MTIAQGGWPLWLGSQPSTSRAGHEDVGSGLLLHRSLCHPYQTLLAPSLTRSDWPPAIASPSICYYCCKDPIRPSQDNAHIHATGQQSSSQRLTPSARVQDAGCRAVRLRIAAALMNSKQIGLCKLAITSNIPAGQAATDDYPRKAGSLVTTKWCLPTAP
jgi:hypothetical protein